jgi:hypothetical protein
MKEVVLCTRLRHADTVSRTRKKQEHVPRHIELTVLREILRQRRE